MLAALRKLLSANEPHLRLLALEAMARIDARSLLSDVGPLLEDLSTTEGAVAELLKWGDDALDEAASGLDSAPHGDDGLSRLLGHTHVGIRDRTAKTLGRLVRAGRTKPLSATVVQPVLEHGVANAFRYLSLLAGLAHDDGTPDWTIAPEYAFLGGEIELRFRAARMHVLELLSLIQSRKLTSIVEVGLRRAGASATTLMDAQIAELLELSLPLELARRIVPIFDKLSLRERLVAAERVHLIDQAAIEDPLAFLLKLGDPHLRVCAMITYGPRAEARYPDAYKEDSALIPVFDRMRFLRSVPLFAEIPGEDLRLVAEIVDTVEHNADAVVFRKGDPGDDMYVIVHGRIAIRDGDADIATFGEREFFGELSVIDREARSADAVVLQQARLLRLRAADLGELMARRPQIQEQILLVLVRRLRVLNARLAH